MLQLLKFQLMLLLIVIKMLLLFQIARADEATTTRYFLKFTARPRTVAIDLKISSTIGFFRIKFMHEAAEVKFQDTSYVKLSKTDRR